MLWFERLHRSWPDIKCKEKHHERELENPDKLLVDT